MSSLRPTKLLQERSLSSPRPSHLSLRAPNPRSTPCYAPPHLSARSVLCLAAAEADVGKSEEAEISQRPHTTLRVPEDLKLPAGELSEVDRHGKMLDSDVFRCFGCTKAECQGPSGCAATPWRFKSDGYLREVLTARVYDVAIQSPLEEAKKLSEAIGNKVLLKREDLQPVFSFKLRGAYNKMSKLSKEQLEKGVITSSAGNHAQGVALAASKMNCRAIICMPVNTPEIKVANVKKLGGIVQLVGDTYQETQAYAAARSVEDGMVFIPPYDDPYTIAGQGTIADELMGQISNIDEVDAIFVPIGGGGLIAGIGAFLKALKPNIKIIGVEPTGANAMAQSLMMGERVALTRVDAFADGVAVKQVGMETFRLCQEVVDGIVLVDNSAISAAIKDVFNETRSILEPAGAVGVAGAKAWLKRHGHQGKTVVAVTSGANINFERLRLVSELANVGSQKEYMLTTTLKEEPGAFKTFIETASDAPTGHINVTEFKYRFSAGDKAQILWGAAISDDDDVAQLVSRMNQAGMETHDISDVEVAQLHLRHLVGGRARSYMGQIPDERIYQIVFPERAGALASFLKATSPRWNITLFHYRNTGNRESSVLIGVQVPSEQEEEFLSISNNLPGFLVKPLDAATADVFKSFIQ